MKQKFLLPIAGFLMAGAMLLPSVSMAQSASSTVQINAISSLLQQIKALQDQIDALKNSQATLQSQVGVQVSQFITGLSLGSQGDAVKALQALLAADPGIYPEGLITGYFGKATENAVKNFQKSHGLAQVGAVGPQTRSLLNKLLGDNPLGFENEDNASSTNATSTNRENDNGNRPCAIVPPGHMIAPGWLKTHGDGQTPIVPACQTLPKGIEDKLNGDFRHGTTTNNIVPMINTISATSTASTTAYVFWTTNKNTTSTFWYGTANPLDTTVASKVVDSNLNFTHSVNLSGLTASTTYNFIIRVTDNFGNSATSTQNSFVTLSM